MAERRYIGKPAQRVDAADKVTGRAALRGGLPRAGHAVRPLPAKRAAPRPHRAPGRDARTGGARRAGRDHERRFRGQRPVWVPGQRPVHAGARERAARGRGDRSRRGRNARGGCGGGPGDRLRAGTPARAVRSRPGARPRRAAGGAGPGGRPPSQLPALGDRAGGRPACRARRMRDQPGRDVLGGAAGARVSRNGRRAGDPHARGRGGGLRVQPKPLHQPGQPGAGAGAGEGPGAGDPTPGWRIVRGQGRPELPGVGAVRRARAEDGPAGADDLRPRREHDRQLQARRDDDAGAAGRSRPTGG